MNTGQTSKAPVFLPNFFAKSPPRTMTAKKKKYKHKSFIFVTYSTKLKNRFYLDKFC